MFKDLTEFMFWPILYCALLHQSRDPVTLFHNYELVTGTFPEHFWNPIYKVENAKLRQIIEENARRNAKNAEHKIRIEELKKNSVDISAENAKLKAKLAKLKHDFNFSNLTRPQQPQHITNMQNLCFVEEEDISAPINRSPDDNANIKPSKEEMMISFLDEVNKKIVSDGIRQRKRDEKLAKVESIFPEKGKQKASEDSSTKCSNTMGELGSNSLDVYLKQSVRSYDSSAAKMETTFFLLYKKLFDAKNFADPSEKQVDPKSNAVSRILNMEVKAQLPADTSVALLWKKIKQAKKLWKLFDAIGIDKIYRIHSFSVSSISKMTYEDI
uniref:Uncharacterized protein n=2 Tax=Rhizophagus irregularis TaxID=588596 RepID=U9TIP1_RHIID